MFRWALTDVRVAGTPYDTEVYPLTGPNHAAYAKLYDMVYVPICAHPDELAAFQGKSTAPPGTEVTLWNVQNIITLLQTCEGVVFIDSDAVIVDPTDDIRQEVSTRYPFSACVVGNIVQMGVAVIKSCRRTIGLFEQVWERREYYRTFQWLEQAGVMDLLGYDPRYPGDGRPSRDLGATKWRDFTFRPLDPRWHAGVRWGPRDARIFHPAGEQPFTRRLEYVQQFTDLANSLWPRTPAAILASADLREGEHG